MKFDLKQPCSTCPFRTDKYFYLPVTRKRNIRDSLLKQQATFTCHKDIEKPDDEKQHCGGALILLEKLERPNQMMRWMERIGFYNRFSLKMDAPVVNSFEEWINMKGGDRNAGSP